MTANFNDIVKQGYVRLKTGKVGLMKKKWLVLKKASSMGSSRLERFEDEVSARYEVNKKEISLAETKQISRLPPDIKKSAFTVCYSNNTSRQFSCESDVEADDWVKQLNMMLLSRNSPTGNEPDLLTTGLEREMKNIYHVCLLPCTKLDFHGECLLQITGESIHLLDTEEPTKRLVTWPLRSLRRYGQESGKFTFEAGRACDTGEGMFGVSTQHAQQIYNKVNDNAHAIATLASPEPPEPPQSSPPSMNNSVRTLPLEPLDRPAVFGRLHSRQNGESFNDAYYYSSYDGNPHRKRPLPPPPPSR